MVAGERLRAWIPGKLAHDNRNRPGVPHGMLVFDIELLNFKEPALKNPSPGFSRIKKRRNKFPVFCMLQACGDLQNGSIPPYRGKRATKQSLPRQSIPESSSCAGRNLSCASVVLPCW